jgi:hypothetical protein
LKRALVIGSALTVFVEIEAALELSEFEGVIAAKGVGVHYPGPLVSWVSLHPDRFHKEVLERRKKGYPDAAELVGHEGSPTTGIIKVPYRFEGQRNSGSSGLFAVKRAFELGFDKVVLCGVPIDQSAGKLDYGQRWLGSMTFRKGFEEALPHLKDRVRSMSGWTRGLLGPPSAEWLRAERVDA